jgi:DNA-binding beta-propeller fold protein YncE
VHTVVGSVGQKGFRDGVGSVALFSYPRGLAIDRVSGVLYAADSGNNRIRVISLDCNVSTLAVSGITDTLAPTSPFYNPIAICMNPRTGNLLTGYLPEHKIHCITLPTHLCSGSGGEITAITVAGSGDNGFKDGPALQAKFSTIYGIAVCPVSGNIVVADGWNNKIRLVTPQGNFSLIFTKIK